VVTFTPLPLNSRAKIPLYPLDRRLGGNQILDPTGTRTPSPRSSGPWPVAILTTLPRLIVQRLQLPQTCQRVLYYLLPACHMCPPTQVTLCLCYSFMWDWKLIYLSNYFLPGEALLLSGRAFYASPTPLKEFAWFRSMTTFIAVFAVIHTRASSWAKQIQSTPSQPISLRSIYTLFFQVFLSSQLLSSRSWTLLCQSIPTHFVWPS
jgi:hypothetical protein